MDDDNTYKMKKKEKKNYNAPDSERLTLEAGQDTVAKINQNTFGQKEKNNSNIATFIGDNF